MTSQLFRALIIVGVACLIPRPVSSHGRLWTPTGRTTALKLNEYKHYATKPKDYDDNQAFCGGLQKQIANGYKCGVCGDAYDAPIPRNHEVGGKFVPSTQRPITGTYTQGQKATFTFEITANHKGWVGFKLCPTNNFGKEATQGCLDQHPVELAPESRNLKASDGVMDKYKFQLPIKVGKIHVTVIIPDDFTCDQCVLQWRYHTGNNWNFNPATGKSEIGVGYQEEFYACADVKIAGSGTVPATDPPTNPTSEATTTTTTTTTITTEQDTTKGTADTSACVAISFWASKDGNSKMDIWCRRNCLEYNVTFCPDSICSKKCKKSRK